MTPMLVQTWGWRRDGYLMPQHASMVLEAPLAADGNIYPDVPLRTWVIMP